MFSYVLAHAQWIGPALLAAGVAIRLVGRALGRLLLLAGLLGTAAFAYQEWQAVHSLLLAGGILLAGVILFGLLAWTVRGIAFLFALVLFAGAWYLILYGWAGPGFLATSLGSLSWAGAVILSMAGSGRRGGWLHRATLTGGTGTLP